MKAPRRSLVAVAFVLLAAGASRPPLKAPVAAAWPTITWGVTGVDRTHFAISDISDSGRAMSFRRVSAGSGFGATTAYADPAEYRGKRVRFSVELRAENALPGATSWLRVDGDGRTIALENNSASVLRGSTDWTTQVTELDVPPEARRIYYGVILQQDGTVHVRNVQVTVVERPVDPSLAWRTDKVGGSSPFYEIVDTSSAGHALTLRRMEGGTLLDNEFGTATTSAPASAFSGRRVTVRAMVRTKGAEAASVWVRAEGGGKTLALENNMAHSIVGTTEWTERTAVLDFPAGTETVSYGLLLVGRGSISVRDISISTGPITAVPMTGVPLGP